MISYLPFTVSLVCGLLWIAIFPPIVARMFGMRIPMGFRGRGKAIAQLSFRQYVRLQGVLSFGIAMFVMSTLDELLGWKLLGMPCARPSGGLIAFGLVVWLIAGVFFGFMSWTTRGGVKE